MASLLGYGCSVCCSCKPHFIQNDLLRLETEDENSILKKAKDAVITLRGVLEGKHDKEIDELLIKTSSLEMGGGQLSTKWLKVLP
ncbi:hypothetical protein PS1_036665 [Malus domestica]